MRWGDNFAGFFLNIIFVVFREGLETRQERALKKIRKTAGGVHPTGMEKNFLSAWCGIAGACALFFVAVCVADHGKIFQTMTPNSTKEHELPATMTEGALLDLCREGDDAAISKVYAEAFPLLLRYMVSLGARPEDAESIVADVLGDCLVGNGSKPAGIRNFREGAALTTWMCTICRNRYFEAFRKKKPMGLGEGIDMREVAATDSGEARDEGLIEAARGSLCEAFSQCEALDLVLLELVHGHRVDQRCLARVLGWTDSRLSRHLSSLRRGIHRKIREVVERSDGALRLDWRDFVDVCENLLRRI
jgi:DNA-directed RNA polymerase specialized sigma24 family protein